MNYNYEKNMKFANKMSMKNQQKKKKRFMKSTMKLDVMMSKYL